jgi:hypothetical protein
MNSAGAPRRDFDDGLVQIRPLTPRLWFARNAREVLGGGPSNHESVIPDEFLAEHLRFPRPRDTIGPERRTGAAHFKRQTELQSAAKIAEPLMSARALSSGLVQPSRR